MERRPLVIIAGRLRELPEGDTIPIEETMIYTKRLDTVSDSLMYKGEAAVGSLESSAAWRISMITIIDDDVSERWADGNSNFDNIWVDRATLSYT